MSEKLEPRIPEIGSHRERETEAMETAAKMYPEIYQTYKEYLLGAPGEGSAIEERRTYKTTWAPRLRQLIEENPIPAEQLTLILRKIEIEREGHV